MVLTKKAKRDPVVAARIQMGVATSEANANIENQEDVANRAGEKRTDETVTKYASQEDESESSSEDESSDEDDLMSGLTEEQKKLIAEKTKSMQSQYQGFVQVQTKSKLEDVMNATGVSDEEAKIALECCNNDEIEASARLREDKFKEYLSEIIEEQKQSLAAGSTTKISVVINEEGLPERRRLTARSSSSRQTRSSSNSIAASGFNMNGDKRAKTLRLSAALKKLEQIKRTKQVSESAAGSSDGSSDMKDEDNKVEKSSVEEKDDTSESSLKTETGGTIVETEDATKTNGTASMAAQSTNAEEEIEYSYDDLKSLEWSEARIKAFLNRKGNPNAYYYRFNAPGELQATGEWSAEESKRFMELIKDGVDYRWGVLSMQIPGRVGYQCSNYYRKLILNGQVEDPNYSVDETGKLKFTRPKGKARVVPTQTGKVPSSSQSAASQLRKRLSGSRGEARPPSKKKKKRTRRRKAGDEYTYADEVDSDSGKECGEIRSSKVVKPEDEVIPGLRCPMTMEPMDDPALSPYGHVMSYMTWIRVLNRKPTNTCPFTKQKLTRRSLIKLTKENVAEHLDKIVHVQSGASEST